MKMQTVVLRMICLILFLALVSCQSSSPDPEVPVVNDPEVSVVNNDENPLLQTWDTPFGVPPFERI